jgi:hypothetical protein
VAVKRMNWIGAPEFFNLNQACRALTDAFGYCVYHVGSSLRTRDYRDVDIRCILSNEEFDRLFPVTHDRSAWLDARQSILDAAISEWLSKRTGLPIDFQFQRRSKANEDYPGPEHPRNAVGIFLSAERETVKD